MSSMNIQGCEVKNFLWIIIVSLFFTTNIFASDRVVNLVVAYKTVYFAGQASKALAVNDQIPAPTLHFKEGDHITINVYNHLNEDTAIHWHGMLVPWQMDGVQGVTQKGIPPGGVFHYQFTLEQSGTYWYHAHAGLQEQQGLYGTFLIDPPKLPHYKYTKDYVVVLSDWSNTDPDKILVNLKKEGDYYSSRFPLQPSLVKFIHDYRKASVEERQQLIDDYKMMQKMRMSIYDFSGVAYDAFLLNGHPKSNPWTANVKMGDVVRLRFIGAGGSTIFHVKIPGTTMQMVHVDGNDVKPYTINDFTIAPGETYDVLVKIQKNNPYIIYAESIDTVGAAYGSLVTSPHQIVNYNQVTKFPEPLPVTRDMMSMMMGSMNQGSLPMDMAMNPVANKKSHVNSMDSMTHEMVMSHDDSNHHSMSNSMKMDSGMRMDASMPMDHSKMKMEASTSNSMQVGSQKPHSISSISKKNMPVSHSGHLEMSDNMNTSGGMQMRHGMSMSHSHDMSMPTEPTIIGDTISPPALIHLIQA
jgi:CopA family copper-resistance protein